MKNIPILFSIAILFLASCGAGKEVLNTAGNKQLTARLDINPLVEAGGPFELRFTVYNKTTQAQKFCNWHTPFERAMSKYLDIKDERGIEVDYTGAMAKRIMPAPADSYIEVKPGDSLSVKVDLNGSYRLSQPGKYTVGYNSQEISLLSVPDSITFIYKK